MSPLATCSQPAAQEPRGGWLVAEDPKIRERSSQQQGEKSQQLGEISESTKRLEGDSKRSQQTGTRRQEEDGQDCEERGRGHKQMRRTKEPASVWPALRLAPCRIRLLGQIVKFQRQAQGVNKWASHVSYSNDVMLIDEKNGNSVEYRHGKAVKELPYISPF
eukprot:753681-Hanusia_phi.AAC.3